MSNSDVKISSARISVFRIPTDQPEESDGTAVWDSTTVLLVELTAEDTTGLGCSYTSEGAAYAAKEFAEKDIKGKNPFNIPSLHTALGIRARNMGKPGAVATAISAIDIALWDLKARLLKLPLLDLLGRSRDWIPAYGSGGFTSYSEKQLINQLAGWASDGIRQVKMKIGRNPNDDVSRAAAVVKALNGRAELFVDANGAYSRKQALLKAEQFGDLGVTWFEEPVTMNDRIGLHLMVERAPAIMNIAAGEYCYVLDDVKDLIDSEAIDVLQADVTRCGGISNFIKISGVCEMYHYPLSAHTSPTVHATLCCFATAAINVEYFHDHVRIEHMIFDGAITARDGMLQPDTTRPGLGLELKRADADKFKRAEWQI
ncbi:MAG: mandelate racemase [Acidobacteriaceae bacterium]|nr:mandelate racemase [Acidobacteriaceae bacterium]